MPTVIITSEDVKLIQDLRDLMQLWKDHAPDMADVMLRCARRGWVLSDLSGLAALAAALDPYLTATIAGGLNTSAWAIAIQALAGVEGQLTTPGAQGTILEQIIAPISG